MHTLPALVLACAIVSPVVADELTVGDPAPALTVGQWLKGEPVDAFENGHVYVVEFWATWCGPCIAGMPHLSELQQEYGDRVTVIGVNIWEREPKKVAAWMEERGDALMQYSVAIQEGTSMAESWMEAAGERGIPASFIVDGAGTIAWIGHPARLDGPLKSVVAGSWDIDAASEERAIERAAERKKQKEIERFNERAADELAAYRAANDAGEALPAIEKILALDPPADVAQRYFDQGFVRTAFELQDAAGAVAFVRTHRDVIWDGPTGNLTRYATMMLDIDVFDGERDCALIVELCERAHAIDGEDAAIASLCARAHMARAIELQREAVEKAQDSEREGLEGDLERYESAVSASD